MRLRNKKTGEIWDIGKVLTCDYPSYETLKQLNEEWEDYQPTEPLIKDAECRVIMRLWANRCGVKTVVLFGSEFRYGAKSICFGVDFGLEHPKFYTIDELCGEEEG